MGAWRLGVEWQASVRDYRPAQTTVPVQPIPLPQSTRPGEADPSLASPPLAQQMVLIVISGLRTDTARRMPTLTDLAQRGASTTVQVPLPTSVAAAWGTLLSGAGPDQNGAPLLDPPLAPGLPITAETLLTTARQAGIRVGVFGRGGWESLLPDEAPRAGLPPTGYSVAATADQQTTEAAREAIRRATVDFAILVYNYPALAGAAFGADSPEYERASQTVDGHVGQLVRDLNLRRSVIAVTADRGLTDTGRAGGWEPSVTTVPLVLAGVGIRPGEYPPIAQTDVAPTLATLLGVAPPRHATGLTQVELLQLPDATRALRGLVDAGQKLALENAWTKTWGTDRQQLAVADEVAGLVVIQSAIELGNDAGAWRLAEPTASETQRRLLALRDQQLAQASDRRLLPFLLVWAALLGVFAWRITPRRVLLALAAGLAWLLPLGGLDAGRILLVPAQNDRGEGLGWASAMILAVAMALVGGLGWLWVRRDPRVGRLTLAGVLAVAVLALSMILRSAITLSDVASGVDVIRPLVWQAGFGLAWGGVTILSLVWSRRQRASGVEVVGLALEYGLVLTGLLLATAAMLWWAVGSRLDGFLPDLRLVFLFGLTLARVVAVGLGGLALPWLLVLLHLATTLHINDLPDPSTDREPI